MLSPERQSPPPYYSIDPHPQQPQPINFSLEVGSSSQANQNSVINFRALLADLSRNTYKIDNLSKETINMLLQNENMPTSSKEKLNESESLIKASTKIMVIGFTIEIIMIGGVFINEKFNKEANYNNLSMKLLIVAGVVHFFVMAAPKFYSDGLSMRHDAILEAAGCSGPRLAEVHPFPQRATIQRSPV